MLDLTAKPTRANEELGWVAKRTLKDACRDLWNWVENNKDGYRGDGGHLLEEAKRRSGWKEV